MIGALLGTVSVAQAAGGDTTFRFGLSYVNPTRDYKGDILLEADAAAGFEVGVDPFVVRVGLAVRS